jgi:hypothetical protein
VTAARSGIGVILAREIANRAEKIVKNFH